MTAAPALRSRVRYRELLGKVIVSPEGHAHIETCVVRWDDEPPGTAMIVNWHALELA